MKNKKKLLVVLACLALCVCTVVTGTLAWLTDKSETVTNTFAPSNINLELNGTPEPFDMIPGAQYTQDLEVVVKKDSVACWVFVKLDANDEAKKYVVSTLTGEGWTNGDGTGVPANVWYRQVPASKTSDWTGDLACTITVNGNNVTKNTMSEAATASLKYTAYAIQQLGFNNPATAWAEVSQLG